MKDDKNGARKSGDFLAGKGFYVVLFACVAIIGVSAWILFFTGNTTVSDPSLATVAEDSVFATTPTPGGNRSASVPSNEDSEGVFSSQTPIPTPSAAPEVKENKPAEETDKDDTPSVPTVSEAVAATPVQPKNEEPSPEPKAKTIEELTFVWPVSGTVETAFSVDMPVFNRTLGIWRTHSGIDIAAPLGTKVFAITDGKVIDVYEDDMMGTTVIIDHGSKLKSTYSNLALTPVVKTGDNVTMGAVIGAVGDTALGEVGEVAHLHLEMSLDGDAVDPASYLPTR